MISKEKRVNKELFQRIMDQGRFINSPFFVFRYINQDKPQYSFVVPKKLSKKAIFRNKMRRIGYNILKKTLILRGLGVFIYKKEGLSATKEELEKEIIFLLKKIKSL